MAGLALAIASLGWCWDGVLVAQGILHTPGLVQWISAGIAAVLLLVLAVKFLIHGAASSPEADPLPRLDPPDGHQGFGFVAGQCGGVFLKGHDTQFYRLVRDGLGAHHKAASGFDLLQYGGGVAPTLDGKWQGSHIAGGNVGRLAILHDQLTLTG